MDFLNKTLSQLQELFRSLSPGARIAAALLLVVVVVSLAYLFQMPSVTGDEMLFGGRVFSSRELAGMEAAFAKAGLNGYEIEANHVRIPRGAKHTYIAALAENNGLPEEFHSYLDKENSGLNLFPSAKEREQRMRHARQKELALIISRMNGVEEATVQIDEVQKGGLNRNKDIVAGVFVWPKGSAHLDEDHVRTIRDTVIASVAGLKREEVTVTDMNAGRSFAGGGDGNLPAAADDPYFERKRMYERLWKDKILSRMSYIPGVNVEVNVELDPELHLQQSTLKLDPKVVAVKTSEASKTATNTAAGPQGRPGTASNVNASAVVSSGGGTNSQNEETTSQQQNVAGHETTVSQKASLVPNRVTASIGVPVAYYAKVYHERNPPAKDQEPKQPDAAELKKIEAELKKKFEDEVVALFPSRPAGTDIYPQVHVTSYDGLSMPPPAEPTALANAGVWFNDNWQTLGMVAVALVSLMMLRGLVRGPAGGDAPAFAHSASSSAPTASAGREPGLRVVAPEAEDEEAAEAKPAATKRRFAVGGPNVRDELAGLVREDPEAAANILKSWIGEAS